MPKPSTKQQPRDTKTCQIKSTKPLDAEGLLEWYDVHARALPWRVPPSFRKEGMHPEPYRVWLSEIMLQQTTVAAVRDYYAKFLALWPSVEDLAAASLDDVLTAWAGLGYYARARNLHACAKMVAEELGGEFPENSDGLRALPGVGPYTAAAIAAICFDEQIAVVDGNVDRVMARYLALQWPVREVKTELRDAVQQVVPKRAGDFAQAMMDLGATICAPRSASCMLCPIQPGCLGAKEGHPETYPIKPAKAERPRRFGHAFIYRNRDRAIWLRQRPEKGLLAKMTETPGSEWLSDWPEEPQGAKLIGGVEHVFTHFALQLSVWEMPEGKVPEGEGRWVMPDEFDNQALPSLFQKVLNLALDK